MNTVAREDDANRPVARFYDNRQKYLMFVNTCSEKREIGRRIARELSNIRPRPPAVRVFDAGVGDGTVLAALMRSMHRRFLTMPFYVVAKEISIEDVRLALDEMPDRLFEHPATVLVFTNLYYQESPWLTTKSSTAARERSFLKWEIRVRAVFQDRSWTVSVSRAVLRLTW